MSRKIDYKTRLTTPFETGIKNFSTVAKYFLYYAPNINSAQSVCNLEETLATSIYKTMLSKADLQGKTKVLKKIQPTSWKSFNFQTDEVDFEDSRMLFNRFSSETEFQALLRHIRNALAHGYIYVWNKRKKGNFIFLVDYDSKEKKVTAKIMVSMKILEQWKDLIEKSI